MSQRGLLSVLALGVAGNVPAVVYAAVSVWGLAFGVAAFSPALLVLLLIAFVVVWSARQHGFPMTRR
ncbi:hypothetical protein [Pectobacterium brasiliense]|uniref:hypothetical protein n=1 Tax=Pectobacterium brasiliense TaxID=180957 RepID=UPI0035569CAC